MNPAPTVPEGTQPAKKTMPDIRIPSGCGAGVCFPSFVFDIAMSIDLDAAERLVVGRSPLGTPRERLRSARKSPSYFDYKPAPLRVSLPAETIEIAGRTTQPVVDLLAFDFGAVCIAYRIPIEGELSNLVSLSVALFDHEALLADARDKVREFASMIDATLRRPSPINQVEDYVIYQIEAVEIDGRAESPSRVLEVAPTLLAQILRSESEPMSADEIADALSCRVSYRPDDAAVIDWNAAILLDAEGDDARPVLEFANVELLEMRVLDDRLDEILDESYRASQETRVGWRALFPSSSAKLRRIAQLQIDSALLFEGVNNALKLIGDQYLARLYHLAARRFHLPQRDQTIERKLETLQSIYTKMSDHESGRRTELLEWIIILLIAFEIGMSLLSRLMS